MRQCLPVSTSRPSRWTCGEAAPDLDRAREIAQALRTDVRLIRERTRAALDVLADRPGVDAQRLAVIGYCLGGAAAVELARTGSDLKAVVGFHAGILPAPPEDNERIRARILLCHGAEDPVVPIEQIHGFSADLSAAGVEWQVHVYGGVGHSFTNPLIDAGNLPGFFHDERADRRSWGAMRSLFEECLG